MFDKQQEQTLSGIVLSRRYECGWIVTFRTGCGEELSLSVSEAQYRDLKEGMVLQFTRKGNILLKFTPKE